LADRLGYFHDAGVEVTVDDFQGGAKALEALVGGSVDLVAGGYENTLLLQEKHVDLKAIELLTDRFGLVLAINKRHFQDYHSPADMRGWKIGVTAPGSSVSNALDIILAKSGVKPSEVSTIGIGAGAGAVAAMRSGELDALVLSDPAITALERDGVIKAVVDGRTAAGQAYIYGGPSAATSVYTTAAFTKTHRQALQAFTTALVRAQKWMAAHSVADVMKKVPPDFYGSDQALYQAALAANKDSFSRDGHVTRELADVTYQAMRASGRLPAPANLDVAATLDDSFWREANK
jgi:NitT/TauT family transport system substrate-binding protein